MFLCKDLAIKLVLSILFLSSTGNDNKSINAEHGFESSFATKNNVVSDVNQEHGTDSKVNKRDPFVDLNTSKQCFLIPKKNKSSFELYNLTEETKKENLTAERRNRRHFGNKHLYIFSPFFGFYIITFFFENFYYIYK